MILLWKSSNTMSLNVFSVYAKCHCKQIVSYLDTFNPES